MAGQPQTSDIFFDVTNIDVLEPAGVAPTFIVPVNGPFQLRVFFRGSGPHWEWLTTNTIPFRATFYAEGLGANAPEFDFGTINGNLVDEQNNYTAIIDVPHGIGTEGLYLIACAVRFPTAHDVAGFTFPPRMLDVYPLVP